MTENEPSRDSANARGMPLVRAIQKRATELNIAAWELAERLEYTEKYLNYLMRGDRWIGTVGHDKLSKIAEFLERPLVTVYVLAGILKPTDFHHYSTLPEKLSDGYHRLVDHKTLSAFVPERDIWERTPEEVRLLCVILYDRLVYEDTVKRADPQASLL